MDTAGQVIINSSSTRILENVGSSDLFDYYQFNLTQASTVKLFNYGVSNSVLEEVLDSSGNVLSSRNTAVLSSDNSISGDVFQNIELAPGSYYIRIQPQAGNTNYSLSVSTSTNNITNSQGADSQGKNIDINVDELLESNEGLLNLFN